MSERRQSLFLKGVNENDLMIMMSTNSWNIYIIVFQEFFFLEEQKKDWRKIVLTGRFLQSDYQAW